jgi:hypothetical protein
MRDVAFALCSREEHPAYLAFYFSAWLWRRTSFESVSLKTFLIRQATCGRSTVHGPDLPVIGIATPICRLELHYSVIHEDFFASCMNYYFLAKSDKRFPTDRPERISRRRVAGGIGYPVSLRIADLMGWFESREQQDCL